jgi:high-affinity nickel permease
VLSNHERAFENLQRRLYWRIEYTLVTIYVVFIVFDIVSLSIDYNKNNFDGNNTLASISECLLCVMVSLIWIMYVALFVKFLHLFKKSG